MTATAGSRRFRLAATVEPAMIACLRGELFHKSADRMIVDVNGVGYEVFFSQNSLSRLPEIGEKVFIHIHTDVKEDALHLYGFTDIREKEMFLLLLRVSGIGPRLALNMLSGSSPGAIARAIMTEDLAFLVKLPGIGKKTAERLCLELKDKVHFMPQAEDLAPEPEAGGIDEDRRSGDVISALVNLGYTGSSARKALEAVQKRCEEEEYQSMSLEELLRQALRALA